MSTLDLDTILSLPQERITEFFLSKPEDQWFERKSGRIKAKDLASPMIAFANAEGGTIVVGLHNGQLDGVTAKLENEVRQAAIDFTVPPVRSVISRIELEQATLLVIDVEPSLNVHTNQSGACFLRIGDESRKLSLSEQQELVFDRGNQTFEATAVPLSIEDLDHDQLETYQNTIGSSSIERMLAARDLVDRQGNLNVAAELLFDARPQRDFPSAVVRILTYDDDDRGVGSTMSLVEEKRIEGSIPQQIAQAVEEVEKAIPKRQRLTKSGKFERIPIIPRDAWLEGIVNAVVHRSYSIMGDHIRVEVFPHRIEITSPGRFPGLADPSSPLKISRYARNPRIARVCSDLGITRELGEGIRRIFQEMHQSGLTEPTYKQSSSTVTLVLNSADAISPDVLKSLPKSAQRVLTALRIADRPLGTGQVAELAGIARPTAGRTLQSLADADLVKWEGNSSRDPRATWRLL